MIRVERWRRGIHIPWRAGWAVSPRLVFHLLVIGVAFGVALHGWNRSVDVQAVVDTASAPVLARGPDSLRTVPLLVTHSAATESDVRLLTMSGSLDLDSLLMMRRRPATAPPPAIQQPLRSEPAFPVATPVARPEPRTHVVQPGETLSGLAARYDVSVNTILWANGLDNPNALSIGQELMIPPVSGVLHVVRPGDTLSGIASRYQVGIEAIAQFNVLNVDGLLQVGQRLTVPGGRVVEPPRPRPVARGGARPPDEAAAEPAPTEASTVAAASGPSRAVVETVNVALEYLGTRYVFGGASPAGFDCSGFVQYIFRQRGIPISRDLWGMMQGGAAVRRDELQPGDLVFFVNTYMPGLSHVGIYIGRGQMVNAQNERVGVAVAGINEGYWAARYYGARRY